MKPTQLQLPEPGQFQKLIEALESGGSGSQVSWQSKHCADMVRFMAFSGCRLSEARKVTWVDVDFGRGEIRVWNAKRCKRSNAAQTRQVPIIPAMRELLERIKKERAENDIPFPCRNRANHVCLMKECEKSLTGACSKAEIARLTHHDLRHLFATRCIEAGAAIPTVSRWLGHQDGGALAMRTYGHLRREHSAAMAQRVTFEASVEKQAA